MVDLVPIENALKYLGRRFDDYDFSQFDLDAPFPELGDIGKNAFQGTTDYIKEEARKYNLTLRQVAQRVAVPSSEFIGTPLQVADLIQKWFELEASDGFIIRTDIPGVFECFVDLVIPILQERGIYDERYNGTTLRENLGLEKPQFV